MLYNGCKPALAKTWVSCEGIAALQEMRVAPPPDQLRSVLTG